MRGLAGKVASRGIVRILLEGPFRRDDRDSSTALRSE
jgi:hypothetical protein